MSSLRLTKEMTLYALEEHEAKITSMPFVGVAFKVRDYGEGEEVVGKSGVAHPGLAHAAASHRAFGPSQPTLPVSKTWSRAGRRHRLLLH